MLRHVVGILFIVLGVVGLVLPILQGILFLGIGTLLLAPDIPFFHRLSQRVERRFPRIGRAAHRWHQRFRKEEEEECGR
ncbi:MAG: hypothetical protein ACQESR_07365 [Planctomycetota bacterium]